MPARYRIEFMSADGDRRTYVLGVLTGQRPSRQSFDPYVSQLVIRGRRGVLVAIDLETGACATRRCVGRQPARRPPPLHSAPADADARGG